MKNWLLICMTSSISPLYILSNQKIIRWKNLLHFFFCSHGEALADKNQLHHHQCSSFTALSYFMQSKNCVAPFCRKKRDMEATAEQHWSCGCADGFNPLEHRDTAWSERIWSIRIPTTSSVKWNKMQGQSWRFVRPNLLCSFCWV